MHKNHISFTVLHVRKVAKQFARAHAKFLTVIASGDGERIVHKRASTPSVTFGYFFKKIIKDLLQTRRNVNS